MEQNGLIIKLRSILLSIYLIGSISIYVNDVNDHKIINQISVGILIDISEMPRKWDENYRSKVITTEGLFHVSGIIYGPIGAAVTVDEYDDGDKYLCIEKCGKIIN